MFGALKGEGDIPSIAAFQLSQLVAGSILYSNPMGLAIFTHFKHLQCWVG